jgi:hypothetical protein
MSASGQAFCLIALMVGLGACLIRAVWEIEAFRERRRCREVFVRNAMQSVIARQRK